MDALALYRAEIAGRHIRGNGIEIGAFGSALNVPPGVNVRYVDKYTTDVTARHHSQAVSESMAVPEIIDVDGTLACVPNESLDFVAMCHVLEHCEDTIGTIETHISKLVPGGVLYYILPDKDRMFDKVRDKTTLDHLLQDRKDGGESSREQHIRDWCDKIWPTWDEAAVRKELGQIHLHAWTANEQLRFWADMIDIVSGITIAEMSVSSEWPEVVTVLRKP